VVLQLINKQHMDEKLDIIIGKINKISTELKEFKTEMIGFKNEMYSFREEMLFFRKDMYRFKTNTESNFKELFEVNRFTGNFFQGHEDRIVALENSR
jgi:archaellum component FlaC